MERCFTGNIGYTVKEGPEWRSSVCVLCHSWPSLGGGDHDADDADEDDKDDNNHDNDDEQDDDETHFHYCFRL